MSTICPACGCNPVVPHLIEATVNEDGQRTVYFATAQGEHKFTIKDAPEDVWRALERNLVMDQVGQITVPVEVDVTVQANPEMTRLRKQLDLALHMLRVTGHRDETVRGEDFQWRAVEDPEDQTPICLDCRKIGTDYCAANGHGTTILADLIDCYV